MQGGQRSQCAYPEWRGWVEPKRVNSEVVYLERVYDHRVFALLEGLCEGWVCDPIEEVRDRRDGSAEGCDPSNISGGVAT